MEYTFIKCPKWNIHSSNVPKAGCFKKFTFEKKEKTTKSFFSFSIGLYYGLAVGYIHRSNENSI